MRILRILHIGCGLRPWRFGGLVAYAEYLMDEQVSRDNEVSYFFSGRHYPFPRRTRLYRWRRGRIRMLEVLNSPLYDPGRQPELELAEPHLERMLEPVLSERRPEVVHVQELAGRPSSLLELTRRHHLPTVVTLQDYFPICSTFKLLDASGQVCMRREIGADCAATVAADPRPAGLLIEATLEYHLTNTAGLRRQIIPGP